MNVVFRNFIDIIVYGNIWISLGATALTLNTFLLMNWEVDTNLLLLVFFATLLSYTFQRVIRHTGKKLIASPRHLWIYTQKKTLFILMIVYALICGYLFFSLFTFIELFYFSPLILIALFYAVKITKKALRDISFIKIILVSLCWAVVTVLIPSYLKNETYLTNIWWLFLINSVIIFALVIPFDIRDLAIDEISKKTIPQLLGITFAKYLAILLILICAAIAFLFLEKNARLLLPVFFICIVMIAFTNKNRPEMFYAFGIDGLILLFPISSWIILTYF